MSKILTLWNWDPSIIVGCAFLIAGYAWLARFRLSKRAILFVAGDLILLFALVSPLDELGDAYLFSAHMVQHLLLLMAVPPLLLLGLQSGPSRNMMRRPFLRWLTWLLKHPVWPWVISAVTLWVWHVPALYNATLDNELLHVFEHLTFLATATLFWWPVLGPMVEESMSPPGQIIYLASAAMSSTLLGIMVGYSLYGVYTGYFHAGDPYGLLPLIRDQWGITPQDDQEIAGVLMWVPGGLVYIVAMVGVFFRWARESEMEAAAPAEAHR